MPIHLKDLKSGGDTPSSEEIVDQLDELVEEFKVTLQRLREQFEAEDDQEQEPTENSDDPT